MWLQYQQHLFHTYSFAPPHSVFFKWILGLLLSSYYTSTFKNFWKRRQKIPGISYLWSLNLCVSLLMPFVSALYGHSGQVIESVLIQISYVPKENYHPLQSKWACLSPTSWEKRGTLKNINIGNTTSAIEVFVCVYVFSLVFVKFQVSAAPELIL